MNRAFVAFSAARINKTHRNPFPFIENGPHNARIYVVRGRTNLPHIIHGNGLIGFTPRRPSSIAGTINVIRPGKIKRGQDLIF